MDEGIVPIVVRPQSADEGAMDRHRLRVSRRYLLHQGGAAPCRQWTIALLVDRGRHQIHVRPHARGALPYHHAVAEPSGERAVRVRGRLLVGAVARAAEAEAR